MINKLIMSPQKKYWNCPVCENETTYVSGAGVCKTCETQGFWVDPAGGIHSENDDYDHDPAAMYE